MSRIMGVDLGDARTGVAISDPDEKMAFGVCTITEYSEERLTARLIDLARQKNAIKVVFGLPVNMDGSKGFRAQKIEAFVLRFGQISGLETAFSDERCSTMLAHTILNDTGVSGKKRKQVVDTLSAEIILQSYLDRAAAEKKRARPQ